MGTIFFRNLNKLKNLYSPGRSDRQFCLQFNIPPGRFSDWKRGSAPTTDWLSKLAERFDKSVNWFIEEHSDEEEEVRVPEMIGSETDEGDDVAFSSSPIYLRNSHDGSEALGFNVSYSGDEITAVMGLVLGKARDFKQLEIVLISSDAMEPFIMNGDFVLLDGTQKNIFHVTKGPFHKPVWAIRKEGRYYLKHITPVHVTEGARFLLSCANSKYEDIYVDPLSILILGRVIWSCREWS